MNFNATAILGIPVDNVHMDEAVSGILHMIEAYEADYLPRYVATVNVDFITNILSWRLTKTRHPELLHILRRADMVTADGMPIVWAARWLGAPLKQRVAGSDFVPRLAEAACLAGKSIYFLGGRRFEMTAFRAAKALETRLPGFKVAGVNSPWVHVAGEALAQAEEEDIRIVDKINASGADILLVAFGSPKQEIWFDRNRHRLKVPVTMGVGATFDFLAGTTARAPKWMQDAGFEWLFRLAQEPKRLWKRYLIDFLKFGMMIWPAVIHRWYETFQALLLKKPNGSVASPGPSHGCDEAAIKLQIPAILDVTGAQALCQEMESYLRSYAKVVFDFHKTFRIHAAGIGPLARIWQRAVVHGVQLDVTGLHPHARRFLVANRLADYFKDTYWPPFSYTTEIRGGHIVRLCLSGVLDTHQVSQLDFQKLLDDVGINDCIFDLKALSYIGSSGLMMMLNISKSILSHGKCFVICSPQSDVRQMFKMTGLLNLLVIKQDPTAAECFIREVRGDLQGKQAQSRCNPGRQR